MKNISVLFYTGLTTFLFAQAACNQAATQKGNMNSDTTPPAFSSVQEAATQAREDLLTILRSDKGIQAGINDTAALAGAVAGRTVRHFSIDFNKLLAANDSTRSLQSLAGEEQNVIVPLVGKNQIVTVVTLSRDKDKWKVASLAGKGLTDELSSVVSAISRDSSFAAPEITLYEVDNLNAKLFQVTSEKATAVFSNYNAFSMRQGVSEAAVISSLREAAIRFQHEFGDQVKKQKLAE